MSDLAEFLHDRIVEDGVIAASAVAEAPELTWSAEKVYDGVYAIDLGPATHPEADSHQVGADARMPREIARHIEAFRPRRVLADYEAKRSILAMYDNEGCSDPCHNETVYRAMMQLAAVYASHPDYQPEWRPTE